MCVVRNVSLILDYVLRFEARMVLVMAGRFSGIHFFGDGIGPLLSRFDGSLHSPKFVFPLLKYW